MMENSLYSSYSSYRQKSGADDFISNPFDSRVGRAYDGIEGIEKGRMLGPFAIILDIMIPKKDGWEVL